MFIVFLFFHSEAIEDCTTVISLDNLNVKAYVRRGDCYLVLKKYLEAYCDFGQAYNLKQDEDLKNKIDKAEKLKNEHQENYYDILGVLLTADEKVIFLFFIF